MVANNSLISCFDQEGNITTDFCKQLSKYQPQRLVFCDSGFKDDSVKINIEQIFKHMSTDTELKTI